MALRHADGLRLRALGYVCLEGSGHGKIKCVFYDSVSPKKRGTRNVCADTLGKWPPTHENFHVSFVFKVLSHEKLLSCETFLKK